MWSLLRRNPDYRRLFLAQVVSFAGDWFATVALVGLVIDRTGSDIAATLVWVAAMLPAFVVTPLAGPMADRYDRKRIMVVCSLLQVGAATLFFLASSNWIGFGFMAQGLIAGLSAFFGPASGAALPNLVDPEDLPVALAATGMIWGAMLAIGSALGAVVASRFGRNTAFAVDAVSFAVAGVLIASIRRNTRHHESSVVGAQMRPIRDTIEGLRYARGNPVVSSLLLAKAGGGLGTGVVGLLAVLAKRAFDAGDGGVGLLLMARGLGVVFGPVFMRRSARVGLHSVMTTCGVGVLVYGLGYLALPLVPVLGVALVVVFLAHLGGGTQWACVGYGIQVSAPDDVRGRLVATDFALLTLTSSISLVTGGVASTLWGPRVAIAILGAVETTVGIVYLVQTRSLRNRVRDAHMAASSYAGERVVEATAV